MWLLQYKHMNGRGGWRLLEETAQARGSTLSTILAVRTPSVSQCGYLNVSSWYQGSWEADSSNYLWISQPTRSGFTHLASAIMVCVTCYMPPQYRLMGRVTGETLTCFLLTYAWTSKVTWSKIYRWVAFLKILPELYTQWLEGGAYSFTTASYWWVNKMIWNYLLLKKENTVH